jgi:DNA polymerase-1
MAVNTPIQGTAADLVKIAMIRVERALGARGLDARLLLQVHDELVLEVAERDVEAAAEVVRAEMGAAAELAVPLEVEVGTGKSWAEAH